MWLHVSCLPLCKAWWGAKGNAPVLVSLGSELLLSLQPRGRWAGISLLTGCSLPLEAACFIAQKLADESWRLPRVDPHLTLLCH